MRVDLVHGFHLSEIRFEDRPEIVRHLQDKGIYDMTVTIPYPYTEADADAWLAGAIGREPTTQFAIREPPAILIGVVVLKDPPADNPRSSELGYWLARPWWGRGIATAAARAACGYGFQTLGLDRIVAGAFVTNPASRRVLEKVGFQFVEILPARFTKDGRSVDDAWYELSRPPV